MKIVIELNDADLRKAVDEQIGKAIAGLADQVINEKINSILDLKFKRINDAGIDAHVAHAAKLAVEKVVNAGFNNSPVREALAAAALKLIKEKSL